MTTEIITVPEIHCAHCKSSIEGALATVEGVRRAVVDVDARRVEVIFEPELVDRATLVRAIEEQGYEVPT